MAAIGPFAALNFAVVGISTTAGMRMTRAGGRELLLHPRHAVVICWTGETSATVEIRDVPVSVLYEGYADLTRMTEWSPLLHSVTVDPRLPSHSVWVMRIPGALKAAARTLGYPETVSWEADLFAPGPPSMNWTSTLDETGRLKGLPDAGFEPAGSVSFREVGHGMTEMTLTLRYTLPDPVEWWKVAIVQSPPIQSVLRNRIRAGMSRFSRTMQKEWESGVPQARRAGEPSEAAR